MNNTAELMRERLAELNPVTLEIIDESAAHSGHAGAQSGGGHYRLIIVSEHFAGMNAVSRHRAIYRQLGELMDQRIHALSINALTPSEI